MTARNRALLAWYAQSSRDLPWRTTQDPWAILVSEVMAQQTTVDRVVPRYLQFMERYPTPAALAVASVADVMRIWSGLGYNRRGLRLREAAALIAAHGWPKTPESLRSLPGVGDYTAAAVACFAFGEQVPTVDTNLRRVLTRWRGAVVPERDLVAYAAENVAPGRAADWNQAVMDLGATVCRPKLPDCASCPVVVWCEDPDAYRPPRPQGRFEGSSRQARGAVIKGLLNGPATTDLLADRAGLPVSRIEEAARQLAWEGIVNEAAESGWALSDSPASNPAGPRSS